MHVVVALHQEVALNGPRHHGRLQSAQSFQLGVARGDGPHRHGVVEIHVLGCRFLPKAIIITVTIVTIIVSSGGAQNHRQMFDQDRPSHVNDIVAMF